MQARADAVIVDDLPLLHTGQIFPIDANGDLVGGDDLTAQCKHVFKRLKEIAANSESAITDVVKLNLYVGDEADAAVIATQINATWDDDVLPAMMWVQTPLPLAKAKIAADAVIIARLNDEISGVLRDDSQTNSMWSILPTGRAVYIAGQAEPGETLGEATTKTLESLHNTLKFMELKDEHVVQIKTFLNPMSQVKDVDAAITTFYKDRSLPPVSHVEWGSKGAIEIEMIAFVPADNRVIPSDDSVVFLTPPTMTASPVFSRIGVINSPTKIYVSGLTANGEGDGEHEVRDIFSQLTTVLKDAGSDLRHMVKATYYVSGDESSNQLNMLRPKYYDPKRPPSASKAPVSGVGKKGRTLSIDMIAVPAK
ncbi:MAG: RidA family protein [Planctomycetota bacterium]|nr:RidA family protein [Planctomycetota bacterium]MDA1212433.1 RidA family protein [Planctomycetota bacterium]